MNYIHDGQHRHGGNFQGFRWYSSLSELKSDLDLEFGQVGEIVDDVIQYRPRNGGVPTLFRVRYEQHGGHYRLTGKVQTVEMR